MFSIFTSTKNTFEGQHEGEQVLAVIRMHWFYLIGRILVHVLSLIVIMFLAVYSGYFISSEQIGKLIFFMAFLYLLFWWFFVFYEATMYYLNTWIVTNERVISNRQKGLFRRTLAELNLGKIQDISVNVEGFFATILDFGEVEIQTAGAEKKFLLYIVPAPKDIKDKIMKAAKNV
jgi:uncharacterized membrane protein YdbT with pleckstrin-like domain